MQKWYSKILLGLIIVFAVGIRLYLIADAPKGALIDEAHFGYLAFSLIETGADEHGHAYPLLFKGFGDQKLPMGAYLMIPVVKLFGLSNATIRYPSILAGASLIIAMWWLARELDFKEKWQLLVALITAVSPWTFFLSRFGFESNLALAWLGFGLVFLLKMYKTTTWYWPVLAGLSLALTWYAYVAYRPVVTLLVLIWLGYNWWTKKGFSWQAAAWLGLPYLLLISVWFHPTIAQANTARLQQVGILEDPGIVMEVDENRTFCSWRFQSKLCYAIWNKPVVVGRTLFTRYLHTFSPEYLATTGESNEKFLTVEHYGQFYHLLYPFFILGLAALILLPLKQIPLTTKVLIISGLVFTAVPGLVVGEPQKVRLSALFPFMALTILFGLRAAENWLPTKIRPLFVGLITLGLLAQTSMYLVNYYGVHSVKAEASYQSYLPELMSYVQTQADEATLINLVPFFSDPLMFYAYYTKMAPAAYQEQAVLGELEASGFQHTVELDNLWAKKITPEALACEGFKLNKERLLYVTDQTLEGFALVKEIKATNGVHSYVKVYEVPVQVCE